MSYAKAVYPLFTTSLLSLLCLIAYGQVEDNQPPLVKLLKPGTDEVLKWNTLLSYEIHVNDAEDGNSDYEEIAEREVILLVKYLADSASVDNYLKGIQQDLEPVLTMSQSTCLNCHSSNLRLIGPAFELIAKKYQANNQAKEYLTQKVINGSEGVWGMKKCHPIRI